MTDARSKLRLTFGKRVRLLRYAREWSQEKLAEQVGVHPSYIGSIERGQQSVSIDNAGRIAKALRVSLPELFRGL